MVTPEAFVEQIRVNVDNQKLSDEAFREFIRNTLPIVKPQEYECTRCGRSLGTDPTRECICNQF